MQYGFDILWILQHEIALITLEIGRISKVIKAALIQIRCSILKQKLSRTEAFYKSFLFWVNKNSIFSFF